MAKKLQLRGGTTSEHSSFTGAVREVTVDTDLKTLKVHDGSTAGGTRLAKHSEIPDVSSFITGVTAGSGIDVSGTTISVETDLRDGITDIGRDNNDYMNIGTEAFNWYINSGNEMRLEADGDLHVDGDVIAFSTSVSDVALKSDIQMIPNALDKIDEVRGVTFTRHNGQKSAGIIAQELEKVLPCAVREKKLALVDGKKYKTVEYDAIHGLLINCIKELKEEIKELKNGFTK
jgi:hypothetical protein